MTIELEKIETRDLETGIQKFWDGHDFWENDVKSQKPKFCTMMPPPNITGSLHLGHAFENSLTDIICRYKRMCGYDVLWQPGTDHASIAMQLMVEKELSANGRNPRAMTNAELLDAAYDYKARVGGQILNQFHILGITPAWKAERFTMDAGLSRAVIKLFVKMYNEGLIYRAKRLVNWCPKQRTTISDLEVDVREENGKFYYFNYPIAGGGAVQIATTRPETMFGDRAIAISPENEKLKHLIGKTAIIPLTTIEIPIIADEHADPDKGTGAVKITPAHDRDDWAVGLRHDLAPLCILTEDAKMADDPAVPEKFRGMDRFAARKAIIADLEAAGLLVKIEDKIIPMPYSERGGCIIEYMVRDEWFVDAEKLAAPVIAAVEAGKTRFLPEPRYNLFMSWMKNIHEWSISRQLWWGHQIPAWYDEDGNVYVAETEEELPRDKKLVRDSSCLDTWFSSGLWPFSTLGWPDKTQELDKYYPTDFMNTGNDLIFFWVARMMMMGIYATGQVPFDLVNFHGMIRDNKGAKMSKTKGNGIDPLVVIDKFGVDAFRYWAATAPIGGDLRYSEDEIKRGSKLLTKLWNCAKFICMNLGDYQLPTTNCQLLIEDKWLLSELDKTIAAARRGLDKYDIFNARAEIDSFFYDVLCDQYLEFVKDRLWNDAASKPAALQTLRTVLRAVLGLYAPFIPFQTEYLWQKIFQESEGGETLHLTEFPAVQNMDAPNIQPALDLLKAVRGLRTDRKIGGGARISELFVPNDTPAELFDLIKSAARADKIVIGDKLDFVL
ncbi:MAG: valine--tRNA ligase [Rickettsiales bacterium]|jgi:valyl-tRNA synthetase|nr:valine--tRNA ligase [Rickettsiales bacterium]